MYAPQAQPHGAPVALRLIGLLDEDLIQAFQALERGLAGATVLVDVRDLQLSGEEEMDALAAAVAAARRAGRDVRLDGRSLHWKRVTKKLITTQPAIDPLLRSGLRRTVILAHSVRRKRK